MEKVKNYLSLNNKYLKEAEALIDKEDYVQASEKFWGAAAEMVKAIAAKRGSELRSLMASSTDLLPTSARNLMPQNF